MYAVVETGGKQFRVEQNSKITVEKLAGDNGSEIILEKVLLLGGEELKLGDPYIAGASVKAEILAQKRGPKLVIFKRRRRKDSKCKHGHRQDLTELLIKDIIAPAQ
ncbi:MAG: 50S ribosomal protein L21 [Desulfovibrio sp.]|nr:50S ribosomal protein L21 [Desulfovibrio sp.]